MRVLYVVIIIVALAIVALSAMAVIVFSTLSTDVKAIIAALSFVVFIVLSILIYRVRDKRESIAIYPRPQSMSLQYTGEEERELAALIGREELCSKHPHIGISKNNEASFNIFIVFISEMSRLIDMNIEDIERISDILCNDTDISKSVISMDNLLTSTFITEGFKIASFENIFRLSKIQESINYEVEEPYALDELKVNLALLKAADFESRAAKEYTEFACRTLSNKVSQYKLSTVDPRNYLHSFFGYLEKFRVNEILVPEENNFQLIRGISYFPQNIYSTRQSGVKFISPDGRAGSLREIISLPESDRPMYVIITFYSSGSFGSFEQLNSFELNVDYVIQAIIFKTGNRAVRKRSNKAEKGSKTRTSGKSKGGNIVLFIKGNTVCLTSDSKIRKGLTSSYEISGITLSEMIKSIKDKEGIELSLNILSILYRLRKENVVGGNRIRPIQEIISADDIRSKIIEKKEEFKNSVVKKFIENYDKLTINRNTSSFQKLHAVLDFIRSSTAADTGDDNDSTIGRYLSLIESVSLSKLPFVEKIVEDFLKIKFNLSFNKAFEELWNSVLKEIKTYEQDFMTTRVLLRNAVEEVMSIFTDTLPSVSVEKLEKKIHSDYILATIKLIKRLWKIYDRCLIVMRLLLVVGKLTESSPAMSTGMLSDTLSGTLDKEEKLLQYLLLKFNKLAYIKCYFISFSDDNINDEALKQKRQEIEDLLETQ
jgi:hypothetical protein